MTLNLPFLVFSAARPTALLRAISCAKMHKTVLSKRQCEQYLKDRISNCPFCSYTSMPPLVYYHLKNHFQVAVHHGDFTIIKCHSKCRANPHFHCCFCSLTFLGRPCLLKHITNHSPHPHHLQSSPIHQIQPQSSSAHQTPPDTSSNHQTLPLPLPQPQSSPIHQTQPPSSSAHQTLPQPPSSPIHQTQPPSSSAHQTLPQPQSSPIDQTQPQSSSAHQTQTRPQSSYAHQTQPQPPSAPQTQSSSIYQTQTQSSSAHQTESSSIYQTPTESFSVYQTQPQSSSIHLSSSAQETPTQSSAFLPKCSARRSVTCSQCNLTLLAKNLRIHIMRRHTDKLNAAIKRSQPVPVPSLPSLPSKKARVEENPPLNFASPRLLFQSLIGSVGVDEFFRQYWEQKPYVLRCSDAARASYYRSLFRFADLEQLCARGICYATDLNVCRCVHGKKKVLNKEGRVKFAQLKKDFAQKKATIQLHQPQRFKDELWRIQERLECFFGSLVGSNVYITPPGSQGLPPHYDDVEVLILQLEGKKRWRLYKPTNPLAREYSLVSESHMGPPTHDFLLQTGDLLYFPRGTIHQAETPEGEYHSTHITLSFYQNMSWGDLLLDVFPELVADVMKSEPKLRRGLPLNLLMSANTSPDVRKQMCETLRLLADDLEQEKCEFRSTGMKRDFISSRLPPYLLETPAGPAGNQPTLEDDVCLLFKEHLLLTLEPSQEQDDTPTELVVFVLHSLKNKRETHMMGSSDDDDDDDDEEGFSQGLRFPGSHLTALRQLLGSERLAVKDLQLQQEPDKLGLVLGLWVEGLLQVC